MKQIENLLEQMIRHQEEKVLKIARDIVPGVTPEDLRNPNDFPALDRHSQFNFEDGILAGLKSALMALRQKKGSDPLLTRGLTPSSSFYMDNHATTAVDPRVAEEMIPCFAQTYGNAGSATHVFGREAAKFVESARERVAHLVNAEAREIIFTSGATESNNLVLKGVAKKGAHIISVVTEHKSVIDPLKFLEASGVAVTYLRVDREGKINLEELKQVICPETVLISVMMANNETGVILPVAEIGRISKEKGILFHSDATQAVGRIPVDVKKLSFDLMSFSAHKMYGPKGVGALYVRRRDAPQIHLVTQQHGGGHEQGLRSGTLNVPGIAGFGKACVIAAQELPAEGPRLASLRNRLLAGLEKNIPDIAVNGSLENRLPGNLNVSFPGCDAQSILLALADEIALSAGSACSSSSRTEPSHVLVALGFGRERAFSSIRFGLGRFNTEEEVDYAVKRVTETVSGLREINSTKTDKTKL